MTAHDVLLLILGLCVVVFVPWLIFVVLVWLGLTVYGGHRTR